MHSLCPTYKANKVTSGLHIILELIHQMNERFKGYMATLWSRARKISAVDCNMRDLRGSYVVPTFGFWFPRVELEKLHVGWNLRLHPLMSLGWNLVTVNPSLKRACGRDEANGWNRTKSYLFIPKGRAKGTSHQLQAPFDDQPWNELHWELWEPSNPTQNALIQPDEQSIPSSCNIDFSSIGISSIISVFFGLPEKVHRV